MEKLLFRLFSVLIICLFSINLFGAEKVRLAVINLESKNISKSTASAVTEMLTTEIINTGVFDVVERNQMDKILDEQGFQLSGCTDDSCAVEIGKLLSANKILLGSLSKIEGKYVINIRIVDVEKGVAERAAIEKTQDEKSLPEISRLVARKIAGAKGTIDPIGFTKTGYYLRGIVPGWGQLYAGSNVKGYSFMSGFLLAGALTVYGIIDFNKKNNEYLDLPRSASQDEFNEKNDAKKQAGIIALSAIGVTGLVYIANWVDVLFFPGPLFVTASTSSGSTDVCFDFNINQTQTDNQYNFNIGIKF